MTRVACKLTAKNRDQLRNPTLGSRVWAFFLVAHRTSLLDRKEVDVCVCAACM